MSENEQGFASIPVSTSRPQAATFVVMATGYLGWRIAREATKQESFDPCGRRVLRPGDTGYPELGQIEAWRRGTTAVAVMLDIRGEVCQRFDPQRATAAAWIEDAFVRARREI